MCRNQNKKSEQHPNTRTVRMRGKLGVGSPPIVEASKVQRLTKGQKIDSSLEDDGLSMHEISRLTGLSVSTVHHFGKDVVRLIQRDADNGQASPGSNSPGPSALGQAPVAPLNPSATVVPSSKTSVTVTQDLAEPDTTNRK